MFRTHRMSKTWKASLDYSKRLQPATMKMMTNGQYSRFRWTSTYSARVKSRLNTCVRQISRINRLVCFHSGKKNIEVPIFFLLPVTDSPDKNLDVAVKSRENIVTYNCTVAYMSQCLSSNKCKQNCESMGATSFRWVFLWIPMIIRMPMNAYGSNSYLYRLFRWFYDGCCECVGSTCLNYGIKESRCSKCPESKDDDALDELPPDEELDFGENQLL